MLHKAYLCNVTRADRGRGGGVETPPPVTFRSVVGVVFAETALGTDGGGRDGEPDEITFGFRDHEIAEIHGAGVAVGARDDHHRQLALRPGADATTAGNETETEHWKPPRSDRAGSPDRETIPDRDRDHKSISQFFFRTIPIICALQVS